MIIFFAYFYTSITFNPVEVAGNLKKSGGFVPGIRPGKPTIDFLTGVLNKIVFIGAVGLTIVALIPIISCGAFNVQNLGFGGTSLIIVVGVILETIKQIESMMLTRHYKGFLSE
jgi:preprotein translocase subunit SecY